MDLILIACCNEKTTGGSTEYQISKLEKYVSSQALNKLLVSRKTLADIKKLLPGPDSGISTNQTKILYKSAYSRYYGIVYKRSNFVTSFPRVNNKKVLIVSALYGILDANDSIREYQAKMDETLPQHTRLATWWKNQHLGAILEEYILNLRPGCVYDLLSNVYRSALAPWPPMNLRGQGINFIQYDYPGEGTGSLWHRGDDLFKLLTQE